MSFEELVHSFKFTRQLGSDPQTKQLTLLGKINDKDAIISFEKTHYTFEESGEDDAEAGSSSYIEDNVDQVKELATNDVYHWGMITMRQNIKDLPTSKLNLIYPATEKHIKKYDKSMTRVVKETPETYLKIVKPYIETMKGDRIQWVRNILYHGVEKEKLVYDDEDFLVLPDMKWDAKTMESLYLVAIVKRDDISSLRDLNSSHIEYLTKLITTIRTKIPEYYDNKIDANTLRIFVHYQPSYYHFHVHIVNTSHPGLGDGLNIGKAYLLDEIIDNLQFLGEAGYAQKTMTYVIAEKHDLWGLGLKDCSP